MQTYNILELQKMNLLELLEVAARYPVMADNMSRQQLIYAILNAQAENIEKTTAQ